MASRCSLTRPGAVPQLDGHAVRSQRAEHEVELCEVVTARLERRRQLQEERRELARLLERLHRLQEDPDQRPLQVIGEDDATAWRDLDLVTQLAGQRVRRRRVVPEQAVELHVEAEPVGRDLRPAGRALGRGQGVEARVELDRLELLGVPRQALVRGKAPRVPLLDEAGIGPARGSDDEAAGHAWA